MPAIRMACLVACPQASIGLKVPRLAGQGQRTSYSTPFLFMHAPSPSASIADM